MKKAIAIALASAITIASILTITFTQETEPTTRTAYGRYYHEAMQVVTDDYNEWDYQTDLVSDRTPTYAMPVCVWFDTKGTAEIYDDEIVDLTYNYDAEH